MVSWVKNMTKDKKYMLENNIIFFQKCMVWQHCIDNIKLLIICMASCYKQQVIYDRTA